ncbi:quinoprotein relay system zinc metallohydrolase 1 [Cupriavidus taiwanensis]|uniref:quinoprotein relay system zinc metallohydrolase 1 n=1 Tax=Cupriavidus taiwanensis TaxID=164546 RepID=UPI000E10D269|nr:quinoprotein relay system zinc metallohydrolase 1 [Cupriavidus taiwanensis]SPA56172.1 putative metal dependent hydrolase [Cupriavidus taiwanensis]
MKRVLPSLLLWLATAAVLAAPAQPPDYRLAPREIAAGVWLLEGANADFAPANGCNIINTAFIDTGDGVVVINTGPSREYGEQQRRAIAALTGAPVRLVLNLNLHPDYFFGNQAYADVGGSALPATIDGARREGAAYADNLYRLCGDWMRGTEPAPPLHALEAGTRTIGRRTLELIRLEGHTDADLVLLDRAAGIVFAGGLVFRERIPTTPHAHIGRWLDSLARLQALMEQSGARLLVPSHGPALGGTEAIAQTRAYLQWLDARLREAAAQGRDLAEVMALPVPEPFARWGALPAEYLRNVIHLYPAHEEAALGQ